MKWLKKLRINICFQKNIILKENLENPFEKIDQDDNALWEIIKIMIS